MRTDRSQIRALQFCSHVLWYRQFSWLRRRAAKAPCKIGSIGTHRACNLPSYPYLITDTSMNWTVIAQQPSEFRQDRRKSPRIGVSVQVEIREEDSTVPTRVETADLSTGGMYIQMLL